MKRILLLCIALYCVILKPAAQDTEFWFVAPDASDRLDTDYPVFLVISNPTENQVTVEVRINGGATLVGGMPYTIEPGEAEKITWLTISEVRGLIENPMFAAGTVTKKGIQIKVTHGEGVLAYYQMDGEGTKDLFSLKGKYALGNEFYIPMMYDSYYKIRWHSYSQIDIVAAEDCEITFTPTRDCRNRADLLSPYLANIPHIKTLAKGETFKLIEDVDSVVDIKGSGLAGTRITSNKANSIAVTVTEDCADSNGAQDIIGDQIVPTAYTGTRYVVVKGHTGRGQSTTDRLYFTASEAGTNNVIVYGDGGWPTQTVTLNNAGDTKVVDIGNDSSSGLPNVVYIESDAPIYCYHVSGVGRELGSALIPSMFSITQQQLAFYASDMSLRLGPPKNGTIDINEILLVFRDTCENYFEISNGGPFVPLKDLITTVPANPIPGPVSGSITWKWAKVTLPNGYRDNNMITIRNSESPFSLGYFNGDDWTATYGYISGFGEWSLPYDTLWRCAGTLTPFKLSGGYALSYDWEFPDGTHSPDVSITLRDTGRYTIAMNVDYKIIYDTVYLYEIKLDPHIKRIPNKPPKVGVPQEFTAVSNSNVSNAKYQWTFEGATPATSTLANPRVVWNSTGKKKVTLTVTIEAGTGDTKRVCEKTVTLDLLVRPKHNGYFVDRNVNGGLKDGSNWQNAYTTIQEALNMASQGDYIWVAEGEYSPPANATYLIDYDSVQIYGGFGAWEANLNERDFAAHPTILNGRNNTVVTFDGSNSYTNASCGVSTAAVLDGFIIQNGYTTTNGAGILFRNGASGTVSNCIIRNNRATQNGGGIYIGSTYSGCVNTSTDPVFFNLEVSGNKAAEGAGIYNSGSDFLATNITVSGNKATNTGGLYNNAGNPSIHNSIIWGNRDNTETEGAMDITASGTPVYTYSILGGSNGSGTAWNVALGTDAGRNMDVTPLFRKNGFHETGDMQQGNYRLTAHSKATNTGRNNFVLLDNRVLREINLLRPVDTAFVNYIPNDLDGGKRIEYEIVDRGAYEFYEDNIDPVILRDVFVPVAENVITDPVTGEYWINSRTAFTLTLYPKEGYILKDVEITTGSKLQDEEGGMQIVYNEDGSVTVTFRDVNESLNIQIKSGVIPVSNEMIDSSYAIWTGNDHLHVRTSKAGILKIYTLTGAMLKQQELTEGEISIPLSQGVFIVTFNDGHQQKVVVK